MLTEVVVLVGIGILAGAVVIVGVHRVFGHLLFEPTWVDYTLTIGMPLVLTLVATAVAGVTAWRGSRVPLTDVLRS